MYIQQFRGILRGLSQVCQWLCKSSPQLSEHLFYAGRNFLVQIAVTKVPLINWGFASFVGVGVLLLNTHSQLAFINIVYIVEAGPHAGIER